MQFFILKYYLLTKTIGIRFHCCCYYFLLLLLLLFFVIVSCSFFSETSTISLREKCPYSELFWSLFFRIWTEYSVRLRENTDENNSKHGHFLRSIYNRITLVNLSIIFRFELLSLTHF